MRHLDTFFIAAVFGDILNNQKNDNLQSSVSVGVNPEDGQLLFDTIMQEIIDMSGSTEMLRLFVGETNILEIDEKIFKASLTTIIDIDTIKDKNIIVRKKYSKDVYHYYGIRNNENIVQRNQKNLLYNVNEDLEFEDIIKRTKDDRQ